MLYHTEVTLTLSVCRDFEADSDTEAIDLAAAMAAELRETIRERGVMKYEGFFVYNDKWTSIYEEYDG